MTLRWESRRYRRRPCCRCCQREEEPRRTDFLEAIACAPRPCGCVELKSHLDWGTSEFRPSKFSPCGKTIPLYCPPRLGGRRRDLSRKYICAAESADAFGNSHAHSFDNDVSGYRSMIKVFGGTILRKDGLVRAFGSRYIT